METEKNTSESGLLDKIWLKYGLLSGGIAIVITVLYYVIDDALMTDPIYSFIPLVTILGIAIYAAYTQRATQDDYLTYSQALTTSLGSAVIGILLSSAFNMLLYFVIDPPLLTKAMNRQLAKVAEMVDAGKIPKESYNAVVKQITEKGPQMFMFNFLIGIVVLIIVALIVFLISSAFLRREPKTQI